MHRIETELFAQIDKTTPTQFEALMAASQPRSMRGSLSQYCYGKNGDWRTSTANKLEALGLVELRGNSWPFFGGGTIHPRTIRLQGYQKALVFVVLAKLITATTENQ